MIALIAEIILGYLTFTGSLMAAGKLQEVKWMPQRPVTYPMQNASNFLLLGRRTCCGRRDHAAADRTVVVTVFPIVIVLALAFGVLLIIPIGGADMPTVIALLNSYAACRRSRWASCSTTSCSSPPAPSTDRRVSSWRSSCARR